jgi:hypothetical protein
MQNILYGLVNELFKKPLLLIRSFKALTNLYVIEQWIWGDSRNKPNH